MCDVLWDCGGASSSTSFTSTFNQLTSSTSNYITTNSTQTNASASAFQIAVIEIWGDISKCTVNQTQTVNLSIQAGTNLSKTSTQDLRNFITHNLSETANQHASASSSMMGGSASTAADTSIIQNIQDVVNTTVSDSSYSSMSVDASGHQDGVIRIHGNCNASLLNQNQYFSANVLATNIMNQITSQLGGLTSNTTSTVDVTQGADSETIGPIQSMANALSAFWNSIGAIGAAGAAACIVCILVCACMCLGLVGLMLMPHGDSS
jgi:hypothetical protein